MNRFLLGVSLAALGISSSQAADLAARPYKAAPAMQQVYGWTGFYIGANVGYGDTQSSSSVTATSLVFGTPDIAGSSKLGAGGVVGGGQIGYNWQTSPNLVFGVEADIQGDGQKATLTASAPIFANPLPTPSVSAESRLTYFGTARARVGYLFSPSTMIYATGGLAYGETELNVGKDFQFFGGTVSSTSFKDTKVGYTVGGGIETMLWNNWTAKAEYLYLDLRSMSGLVIDPAATESASARVQFHDHIFRVGVNYKFGSPTDARY